MKHFLIYLFIVLLSAPIMAIDNRFEKGNSHYSEEQYEEAINAYNEILNSGVESADLYYNLGNSYYKKGKLPEAILNYERALLLSPHDKDIRYNLEMTNTQITDKLENVGEFFISQWINNFKNSTKSDTWASISIISFVLFIIFVGMFFLNGKRIVKQISFFIGIFCFCITFFAFNFSLSQKNKLVNRESAIIFEPSVAVKSSPSTGGNELFILHEGTKVKILESVDNWNRIEIRDGNDGWIPSSTIEII